MDPDGEDQVPGYQLNAAGLIWRAGDGESGFHDPIRMPSSAEGGAPSQRILRRLLSRGHGGPHRPGGHEHTAQVPNEIRMDREEKFAVPPFRSSFCSPTMELGVDIAAAQRGRACATFRPRRRTTLSGAGGPAEAASPRSSSRTAPPVVRTTNISFVGHRLRWCAGQVTAPRLDLTNEELMRAHLHAIWLSRCEPHLGSSLRDLLDLSGDDPSLTRSKTKAMRLHDRACQREGRCGQRHWTLSGRPWQQMVGENMDRRGVGSP
jgi:hypothetical protein